MGGGPTGRKGWAEKLKTLIQGFKGINKWGGK